MAGILAISFVSMLGLTSLILLILSGALYKTEDGPWWGMMVLIPYVLIPIPRCICSRSDSGVAQQFGFFLEGILWTCVFGIPR
jgi:hypothetical protein